MATFSDLRTPTESSPSFGPSPGLWSKTSRHKKRKKFPSPGAGLLTFDLDESGISEFVCVFLHLPYRDAKRGREPFITREALAAKVRIRQYAPCELCALRYGLQGSETLRDLVELIGSFRPRIEVLSWFHDLPARAVASSSCPFSSTA